MEGQLVVELLLLLGIDFDLLLQRIVVLLLVQLSSLDFFAFVLHEFVDQLLSILVKFSNVLLLGLDGRVVEDGSHIATVVLRGTIETSCLLLHRSSWWLWLSVMRRRHHGTGWWRGWSCCYPGWNLRGLACWLIVGVWMWRVHVVVIDYWRRHLLLWQLLMVRDLLWNYHWVLVLYRGWVWSRAHELLRHIWPLTIVMESIRI